jgi:hypothetical protein
MRVRCLPGKAAPSTHWLRLLRRYLALGAGSSFHALPAEAAGYMLPIVLLGWNGDAVRI